MEPIPQELVDRFGRQVSYLRLSVTDRCDFRCVYCMAEKMEFVPKPQVLTLEEHFQVARAFTELAMRRPDTAGPVREHVRRLLRELDGCRELLIPPGATMWVEFGIDEERLKGRWLEARFKLTVKGEGQEPEVLLDRTLDSDSEKPWRGRWLRLARFSYQEVELCVSTEVSG